VEITRRAETSIETLVILGAAGKSRGGMPSAAEKSEPPTERDRKLVS
jgi:hypothetical protein